MNSLADSSNAMIDSAVAADAMYSFAFEMVTGERWLEAAEIFRAMLLFFPRDERSWLGLGRCHHEVGQSAVALELYGLGVRAVPGAVRTRVALARLLQESNRENEAEQVLEAAEQIAESLDDGELVQIIARARRQS